MKMGPTHYARRAPLDTRREGTIVRFRTDEEKGKNPVERGAYAPFAGNRS